MGETNLGKKGSSIAPLYSQNMQTAGEGGTVAMMMWVNKWVNCINYEGGREVGASREDEHRIRVRVWGPEMKGRTQWGGRGGDMSKVRLSKLATRSETIGVRGGKTGMGGH